MHIHSYDNGLVLLIEPMPWTESVSCSMLIPSGPVLEASEQGGLAALLCEMTLRGAGGRDSREFLGAVENLGCEIAVSVSGMHTGFGASLLSANFLPALELLADQVRRPHLSEDQLDAAKQVLRQDIFSLEDDPARQLMRELRHNFLPEPWNRSSEGTLESIDRLTIDDVRQRHENFFQPAGTILSVAGNIDDRAVTDRVGELFGDWQARKFTLPPEKRVGSDNVHVPFDSAQTHIGVAYPCEPLRSPDYMLAWSAVGVLSGGMSSRLFDEIREKRGLCYSVYASYASLRDRAGVYCYCGTGADRAQESLDVLLEELDRLRFGITEDELRRLKIRARTTLVMQQESTGARSAMMTRDWYHLDRIRTLDEIDRAINSLEREAINDYLAAHPPGPFHVVTLGPEIAERSSL